MSLVLDCSATLAFLMEDEKTSEISDILNEIVADGAIVPALWHLEVANGLSIAVRRKRISQETRNQFLGYLVKLDISVDDETQKHAWSATIKLADLHGLTLYDAAYLELAQRRRLPLATLDTDLAAAARKSGVDVLPKT